MPARLKIRVMGGRSLPVMDKSSDTSDAFVEVKIGNFSGKTEVCRHSLNPVWNSEWFKFEVPDEELQDENLQIRIMDYDTYSANDAIGKVYVNLNPLLSKECGHTMWGFFPIYDTMHGTRGEIYCVIKMEPFSDSNRFRQTSCGVRFFHSPTVPSGYSCAAILGFVEELVVNDDPEYQWIDKIRTPRASNEARQTLFFKLSGEVQRKIGLKALDLGGNAVLGYQLCFDLEGESGIVVRGIGTAVMLSKREKLTESGAGGSKRSHTTLGQPGTDESGCPSPSTERSHSPIPNPPVAFLEPIEIAPIHHVTGVPPMHPSPSPLCSPLSNITPPKLTGWLSKFTKGRQSPSGPAQARPVDSVCSTSGSTGTGSFSRRSHSPCGKSHSYGFAGGRSDKQQANNSRLMRVCSSPVSTHAPIFGSTEPIDESKESSPEEIPEETPALYTYVPPIEQVPSKIQNDTPTVVFTKDRQHPTASSISSSTNSWGRQRRATTGSSGSGGEQRRLANSSYSSHSLSQRSFQSRSMAAAHTGQMAQQGQETDQTNLRPDASSPIATNSVSAHRRNSSEPDMKGTSFGSNSGVAPCGQTIGSLITPQYKFMVSAEGLHLLEYPFITMKQFPSNLIRHIGGLVSSRSVKHLAQINSPEDPETRDAWWMELRKEIRSHCRLLGCNAVLGYTESSCICDDVVILSVSGTATILNTKGTEHFSLSPGFNDGSNTFPSSSSEKNFVNDSEIRTNDMTSPTPLAAGINANSTKRVNCSLCHIPYNEKQVPFGVSLDKCGICGKFKVPDILLMNIEPPTQIPILGIGCLIQARVFRHKRDTRGEQCAKEISDSLPFLEYEIHKQLLSKLKMKGMNTLFGLNVQISVGENMLVAIATGTGAFMNALPLPSPPQISSSKGVRSNKLNDIQKIILDAVERNKERYKITSSLRMQTDSAEREVHSTANLTTNTAIQSLSNSDLERSVDDSSDDETVLMTGGGLKGYAPTPAPENCVVLEVDDSDDADIISLMIDSEVPKGYEMCNTDILPGEEEPFLCIYQTFTKVFRAKVTNIKQFSTQFDWIIQSLFVKLRRLIPCAMTGLRFKLDAPESDVVQVAIVGSVAGLRTIPEQLICRSSGTLYLPTHCYQEKRRKLAGIEDNADMFHTYEEEFCAKLELPATISSVHDLPNRGNPACVEITTLSYLPGCSIVKYMGNLIFPFIRETTSIRECGGLNGFMTSFLNEVLLIVRTHIVGLDGNALVSMNITQCVLLHNPHKNQAQCLIIISGDVVKALYGNFLKSNERLDSSR